MVLIPVFCILYLFSLTFLYVEGDDAYSVMYHALGRNPEIERSYGPYQAMMDVWLSVLPPSEPVVRVVAIALHAAFAIVFPIVIIRLLRIFGIIDKSTTKPLLLFCVLLPFACPELIFFGLYYQCSSIALSLVLIAHLLFRNSVHLALKQKTIRMVAAILIFSIGTCIRWDVGFYLIVIMTDILLVQTNGLKERSKIFSAIGWTAFLGLLCLAGVLLFICLEGYSLSDISKLVSYSQQGRKQAVGETSWKINIGSAISLFTPFFLFTFCVGIFVAIRNKKYALILLLVLSYIHVWKLYESEFLNPRRIINSIPFLIIISFIGFQHLYTSSLGRRPIAPMVIVLCFIPWVVGFKIHSADTMWGPGFEMKNQAVIRGSDPDQLENVDDRIQLNSIALTFLHGGFAVPFEGPRPVWGYFGVIFGGEWRQLLQYLNDERDQLLAKAIAGKVPVLQQDFGVNAMINLVRDNYTTNDKLTGIRLSENLSYRRFFRGSDTVTFLFPPSNAHLSVADPAYVRHCGNVVKLDSLYLYIYSSSILSSLKSADPKHIHTYGPATGVALMSSSYQ